VQFGEHADHDLLSGHLLAKVPYETDRGPRGPLFQQTFGGVTSEPCRGVRDADNREADAGGAPGEEVLSDEVSAQLRAGAGRLDPAVDTCGDWEHAPTSGTFLLACNQTELQRYLSSGLEQPSSSGLRIDVVGPAARPGVATIPAVRRNPRDPSLDAWRVTATSPTVAEIYAACQADNDVLEARFPGVPVAANAALRVDVRERASWRVRDARGAVVAQAAPVLGRRVVDLEEELEDVSV
jgi:hypothetical protein